MEFDAPALERFRLKLRYKVCYHLGSVCPDVDDLVQETLARMVAAARESKIQNPASIGAFLSGICNNVILEYRRRLWRESPAESGPAPQHPLVAPEADALAVRDAVAAALAELSDRDGEILRAFFLEDQDKEEICRATGLSDSQFRVVLFRAKDRFRKIYRQNLKRAASAGH
jgi:RNA polymerase sigma-70 factor (ECF subfamily)